MLNNSFSFSDNMGVGLADGYSNSTLNMNNQGVPFAPNSGGGGVPGFLKNPFTWQAATNIFGNFANYMGARDINTNIPAPTMAPTGPFIDPDAKNTMMTAWGKYKGNRKLLNAGQMPDDGVVQIKNFAKMASEQMNAHHKAVTASAGQQNNDNLTRGGKDAKAALDLATNPLGSLLDKESMKTKTMEDLWDKTNTGMGTISRTLEAEAQAEFQRELEHWMMLKQHDLQVQAAKEAKKAKKKGALGGLIGSGAGAALGWALAAPTGGTSVALMGAGLGSGLGGGIGSYAMS